MKGKFQTLGNHKVVDLIPYLQEKLKERDDIKIYIGSDSQNLKSRTIYASVIVLHYGNNGCHVIYSRRYRPKENDFSRHWHEVQDSIDIAKWMESNGLRKPDYIDLDFNPDPKYRSNAILRSALGYVESMGYCPRHKPDSIAATYVADRLC
jgi:predicted RNase H-related nuclease YkuK (DUF458 family)